MIDEKFLNFDSRFLNPHKAGKNGPFYKFSSKRI